MIFLFNLVLYVLAALAIVGLFHFLFASFMKGSQGAVARTTGRAPPQLLDALGNLTVEGVGVSAARRAGFQLEPSPVPGMPDIWRKEGDGFNCVLSLQVNDPSRPQQQQQTPPLTTPLRLDLRFIPHQSAWPPGLLVRWGMQYQGEESQTHVRKVRDGSKVRNGWLQLELPPDDEEFEAVWGALFGEEAAAQLVALLHAGGPLRQLHLEDRALQMVLAPRLRVWGDLERLVKKLATLLTSALEEDAPQLITLLDTPYTPAQSCARVLRIPGLSFDPRFKTLRQLAEHAPDDPFLLAMMRELDGDVISFTAMRVWLRAAPHIALPRISRRAALNLARRVEDELGWTHDGVNELLISLRYHLVPTDYFTEALPTRGQIALVQHTSKVCTNEELPALFDAVRGALERPNTLYGKAFVRPLFNRAQSAELFRKWPAPHTPLLIDAATDLIRQNAEEGFEEAFTFLVHHNDRLAVTELRMWLDAHRRGASPERLRSVADAIDLLTDRIGDLGTLGGLTLVQGQGGDLSLAHDGAGGLSVLDPAHET